MHGVKVTQSRFPFRGAGTTMAGRILSPRQVVEIVGAFQQGVVAEHAAMRAKTPPPTSTDAPPSPGSSSGPWVVDALDRAIPEAPLMSAPTLFLPLIFYSRISLEFGFMLNPIVKENLKLYHAVFKITAGWRGSYAGRRVITDAPDPLQSASGGQVPPSHLAVTLTAHTKGAAVLQENIPEKYLDPYTPHEKNTLCMVIKHGDGAESESVGMVLRVTASSIKNECVMVRCLDGSLAKEKQLPWDRVIRVNEVDIPSLS